MERSLPRHANLRLSGQLLHPPTNPLKSIYCIGIMRLARSGIIHGHGGLCQGKNAP